VWHLIGLKSRVLIQFREGLVSVASKALTDASFVSVASKGVTGIGGLRDDGGLFEEVIHGGHRPFSEIPYTIIHELSQQEVKSL
jgi:hypothetical protein